MWAGELGNKIMSPTNIYIYSKYQALDSAMGGEFRCNIGKLGEAMGVATGKCVCSKGWAIDFEMGMWRFLVQYW